ncbi:hypothetical protein Q4577_20725 [Marinovum sp. 2_MG-2023]|uniref:hypothetical protein n=1 Tax=unclassified Marinovum TaxID=2647166 RepID=UPI0026E41746|nr:MULTISPECIES: hypothetical protein [unclassified Marinovum]MDO6732459.1 hypothetical protein [Marinovum sp. 2_MG-2023]MDO6781776.1 hypothetical protein [Marinovum sp. 1_MG-2023]
MPGKPTPRCALQFARQRRLDVYPEEFGLEQDICDVTLWLVQKYRLPSALVWVDRHYVHSGRQIADITVMTSPRHPDPLTPAGRDAFLALGYEIDHPGADTYGHQCCDGRHSQHETLQAYARIEAALRSWRER